jgi:uncharacterized protein (TIGR03086 family)
MTESPAAATLLRAVGLLERAISYTMGNLHNVTSAALSHRTPCGKWDLSDLLAHMDDSLTALHDAIDRGHVDLSPATDGADPAADLVAVLRERAGLLLGACARTDSDLVTVGGCPVSASIVTSAGAIEVAIHGWDVAQACGRPQPIPPALAEELLQLSPLLVTAADRPGRFAAPVAAAPHASESDRLVAFLGRDPGSG